MLELGGKPTIAAPSRSAGLLLTAVVVAASGVTLLVWPRAEYFFGDSVRYLNQAHQLWELSKWTPYNRPFYSALLALAGTAVGDLELGGRLISFCAASLSVLPAYLLFRQSTTLRYAAAATALFALNPLRAWSGQWILADSASLLLVLTGTALCFGPESDKRWAWAAGGFVYGLAVLTRPENAAFALVAVLLGHVLHRKERTAGIGLFLLALGLVLVPSMLAGDGQRLPTSGIAATLAASDAYFSGSGPAAAARSVVNSSGLLQSVAPDLSPEAVGRRYLHFARLMVERLQYLSAPSLFAFFLLLLGSLRSLIPDKGRNASLRHGFGWQLLLLSHALVLPFFWIEDRYLLPLLPLTAYWIVRAAQVVGEAAKAARPGRLAWVTEVGLPLLVAMSFLYRIAVGVPDGDRYALERETGRWLRASGEPAGTILGMSPVVAYYAGMEHIWLPAGAPEDVSDWACRQGVRYAVAGRHDYRTALTDALLSDSVPIGFRYLHGVGNGERAVKLFALTCGAS